MFRKLKNPPLFNKNTSNQENQFSHLYKVVTGLIIVLYITSIFFPIKVSLNTSQQFITGYKSDFLIIFLYLSDILLLCLFYFLVLQKKLLSKKIVYLWGLFIFSSLLSIFYKGLNNLAIPIYYLALISSGFVTYETVRIIFNNIQLKKIFISTFLILSVTQSLLVIYQWNKQQSFGLFHVGESNISRETVGVAKIDTPRGKLIRPYGTFPHPNILSVFLLTAWFIGFTLLKPNKHLIYPHIYGILTTFCLLLTFSRSTIIIWTISLIALLLYNIIKKLHRKHLYYLLTSLVTLCLFITINSQYLLNRYNSAYTDGSLNLRNAYNLFAYKFIQNSPIFGIGPGQTMFQMKQNNYLSLKTYEIQPIHNFPLLIWTEFGIIPLLIILFIAFLTIMNLWKSFYTALKDDENKSELFILMVYIFSILALSFTDHYFYTSRQGILIFWGTIGVSYSILLKLNKKDVSDETSIYEPPSNN